MPRYGLSKVVTFICVALLLTACNDVDRTVAPSTRVLGGPSFTPASGVGAIDFGPGGMVARATFDAFKVKRQVGEWEMEMEVKPSVDIGVRSFVYAPGSYTGWHTHPGPVFIQVLRGTVTFYSSDDPNCTPVVVHAGGTFLDTGEHAHIGRNETGQEAQDLVVLFAPQGAPFRIDAPDPGTCPFPS